MITKAVIQDINGAGNRCVVRMPLFETASSSMPVEAQALVNITPGMFNNLNVNDVVFVAFEENALEKPIIIGKLYRGTANESNVPGGMGIVDTLKVRTAATIPCTTLFEYPKEIRNNYKDLETPKKIADYIKWLEKITKKWVDQLNEQFKCFKNWTQWQLRAENVEVDDGNVDESFNHAEPCKYQKEGSTCRICGSNCTKKDNKRSYLKIDTTKNYPNV